MRLKPLGRLLPSNEILKNIFFAKKYWLICLNLKSYFPFPRAHTNSANQWSETGYSLLPCEDFA